MTAVQNIPARLFLDLRPISFVGRVHELITSPLDSFWVVIICVLPVLPYCEAVGSLMTADRLAQNEAAMERAKI
jgi:hypothetical protein